MIERIMVPLDGSTFSEFALPVATDVARRTGAEMELVTVSDPLPSEPEAVLPEAALEAASGRYLRDVVERIAEGWDGPVDFRVMRGPVVRSLEAVSADLRPDLVVMATHGRGPLSRFWLGSVADGFVRHSPAPVLLVRPREEETPDPSSGVDLRRILLPLDPTDLILDVVEKAVELGEPYDARYRLFAVVHHPSGYMDPYYPEAAGLDESWMEEARKKASQRLETEAERMESRGLEVDVDMGKGRNPAAEILDAAEEWSADLIAMGTHGRSGVSRMLLGSVSDKVVRGGHRPVLLYRPPAE